MKKVLFVINNLCGGGAERVLTNVLNNFPLESFNVDLLLFWKDGVYLNQLRNEITIHSIFSRIPKNNLFFFLQRCLLRVIVKFPFLFYPLAFKHYDVEIAFLEGLPSVYISNRRSNKAQKITWIHTNVLKNSSPYYKMERNAYRKMDKIVFVSREIMNLFIKKYPSIRSSGLIVLHNPVDTKQILSQAQENCEEVVDKNFLNIFSVGRLSHQKGFDRLINVANILVNQKGYKSLRFYIIGSGELKEEITQKIKSLSLYENIILMGFRNNPFSLLSQADLFFLTSRFEGFPMVLLEAKTLSIPIVASECSGVSEIIKDKVNGFLVTNDSDEMFIKESVAVIEMLLQNNSALCAIRKNLMEECKENQNLDAIYKFLEN